MDTTFPDGMLEDIANCLAIEVPSGLDYYSHVFDSALFFPLQRIAELKRMVQIARTVNPVTVFEIGADKGGSVYHWLKCLPSVRNLIASEIRGTPYASLFEETFPKVDFLWDGESSHAPATVKRVRSWLGQSRIDVLFIDGDKTRTVRDFEAYLPLMNPAGVVFVHDIQDHEPMHAFHEIRDRWGYQTEVVIDTREAKGAALRQIEGIPAKSPHEAWLRHWKGMSCGVGVIHLSE